MIRAIWAPVRCGFSRRSEHANSKIVAGVRGLVDRGPGLSASNPPPRHARIHRSKLLRLTRTVDPVGAGMLPGGQARTIRPRWAWLSAGSAASLISA